MIRNLVLKLPSLTCSSESAFTSKLRQRDFRSLSPVSKFTQNKNAKTSSDTSLSFKPPCRPVTYTQEHFNKKGEIEEDEEPPREIKWREQPQKRRPKIIVKEQKKKHETKAAEELTETKEEEPSKPQIQYYEQYELEAARPRPVKSREIIEQLKLKPNQSRFGSQLQPNELQPYGSRENMYSYNLLASNGSKAMRHKVIKKETQKEEDEDSGVSKTSRRTYSTHMKPKVVEQEAESESATAKNSQALRPLSAGFKLNVQHKPKLHWAQNYPHLEISPPKLKFPNEEDSDFVKISPQKAHRLRRERANKEADVLVRKSYSDIIKLKDRVANKVETSNDNVFKSEENCIECAPNNKKTSKILNSKKTPPITPTLDKRNMSTFPEKNIVPVKHRLELFNSMIRPHSQPYTTKKDMLSFSEPIQDQKANYSKAKGAKPFRKECYDPCREQKKKQKAVRPTPPMEPKDLDCKDPPKSNKVFLASKVRLPVVKCLPKFEYDCRAPEPCPPRADECLKVLPKRLPTMIPKECPCVEETFKDVPKLKRLCFEFKDPPKEKCYDEPCTTPRADDANPYKFKPLKPLVMGDCECVEPPPMKGVKLKRLPPCQPHDVCWPVREPCEAIPCPPRADDCLKVTRKRLPIMEPSECPCEEPPKMTTPPLPRLCLEIPEPKRVCPPPPVCDCNERADKCMKPKMKKLPKFVPGDCPCEDRPMTDVNFRRLECVDEPRECIVTVPDHCQPFPRADYGCWEFEEDTCYEVPEHCVQKKPDPCDPPKCKDPCERRDICKTSGPLNYNPKRKYNTDSTSMKLFNKIKNKHSDLGKPNDRKNITVEASAKKSDVISTKETKPLSARVQTAPKRNISLPTLNLLKQLGKFDPGTDNGQMTFKATNSQQSTDKVEYKKIIKKIKSTSSLIKKKASRSATSLKAPLCISSRAISTSPLVGNQEKKIRDAKALEFKRKCQKIKPKTICHRSGIKGGLLCGQTKCKDTEMCKKERVPVCCEKEDAPYPAFSDKIYDMKVNPYKDLNHCFKCQKTRWPCTPDYKPDCEKRKFFCTLSQKNDSAGYTNEKKSSLRSPSANSKPFCTHSLIGNLALPSKEAISAPIFCPASRSYATKVFKLKKAEIKCDDLKGIEPAQKIMCINYDYEPCQTTKKSCKRIFYERTDEKIKTPYPAFSDCLDEDMEEILSECPLERDKYTQLQPRDVPPANRIRTPLPPPPKSEPLDLLKEQHCIKARLGKYGGTTQDCKSFGNKMRLLKARDVLKETNKDCERVMQLKKEGRWPPFTLIQNRHNYYTLTNLRQFSTFLGGLNSLHEITGDSNNKHHTEVKRIYIRNFHSLIKNPEKSIFTEIDNKIKELNLKQFPDGSDSCKLLKLKSGHWRKENLKKFEKINARANIPVRIRRFYTNYKIKQKYHLKKSARTVCSKAVSMQRRSSDPKLKFFKSQYDKKCKKKCPKFGMYNCPAPATKSSKKKEFLSEDCSKPNTPIPSFSETGEHDLSKPFCECAVDENQLNELQPKFSVLPEIEKKKFPTEEKIDTTLGREYCRQKMGIPKGLSLNCKNFPEYVSAQKAKRPFKLKQPPETNCKTPKPKSAGVTSKPQKEDDTCNVDIECVIPNKNKTACDPCKDLQSCCSQILEDANQFDQSHKPVIPPCCLPEEDRACREYCKRIVLSNNLSPEERTYKEFCKKIICYENSDAYHEKPDKLFTDEDICKNTSEDVKDFCRQVVKVNPNKVPAKISGISEECAQKLLKDCEKLANLAEKCIKKYSENTCEKKKEDEICKSVAVRRPKSCSTVETKCEPKCEKPSEKKCPKFTVPCQVEVFNPKEECRTEPSKMLSLWQRIVNYFKARPGCPEPGDWKKKALNDKAHKAAAAAGLVAIDPQCLPPEVLEKAKSDPCCRACPSEQPICKPPEKKQTCKPKEDDVCKKPKVTKSSCESGIKKGKFGIFKRNYSKSLSWTNLEEINKMLEEAESKRKNIQHTSQYLNKEFAFFCKDEDHSEQIRKSLQYQLKSFPIKVSTVCLDNQNYSKSYFGYSNILPSRENMLERAWRLTMEAVKRTQGEAQAVGLLNDIFKKVDSSIKSQEDIEKMKTENVLRELDQFLQLKEDSSNDKKK